MTTTVKTKRMKYVYSNFSDVMHLFANKSQDRAESNNVFFSTEETTGESTIFSYGRHFPMAKFIKNEKGAETLLFTEATYSSTTARHLSSLRSAVSHIDKIFVPKVSTYGTNKNECFDLWAKDIQKDAEKMVKSRKYKEMYFNQIGNTINNIKKYAEFFGYEIPALLQNIINGYQLPEFQEALKVALQEESKRLATERKEKIQEAKKDFDAYLKRWHNNEVDYFRFYSMYFESNYSYLRIPESLTHIETSQRIRVELNHAKMLYMFVKRALLNGGCKDNCNMKVNHTYDVKEVNKDYFIAGCHKIPMSEINRIAELMNW